MATRSRSAASRRPLTPARQDLAARYVPMARALARPLCRAWPVAFEDFESAAQVALVEAASSFDPRRNVRFTTFARHRIVGALRDVQRHMDLKGWNAEHGRTRRPRVVSLRPTSELLGSVITCGEPDPSVGFALDETDALEAWLRKLPRRHAAACREIYLNGCTQAEAAHRLGCSQSRLSYMHREALEMLRDIAQSDPSVNSPASPAQVA